MFLLSLNQTCHTITRCTAGLPSWDSEKHNTRERPQAADGQLLLEEAPGDITPPIRATSSEKEKGLCEEPHVGQNPLVDIPRLPCHLLSGQPFLGRSLSSSLTSCGIEATQVQIPYKRHGQKDYGDHHHQSYDELPFHFGTSFTSDILESVPCRPSGCCLCLPTGLSSFLHETVDAANREV